MPIHKVGDAITLTLLEKYVKGGRSDAPGKVIYAPDSDRMKSRYQYYVFDEAAYVAVLGGKGNGGTLQCTVTAVADKVSNLDNSHPQPDGGFQNTYFACNITGCGQEGADAGNDSD